MTTPKPTKKTTAKKAAPAKKAAAPKTSSSSKVIYAADVKSPKTRRKMFGWFRKKS